MAISRGMAYLVRVYGDFGGGGGAFFFFVVGWGQVPVLASFLVPGLAGPDDGNLPGR